MFIKALFVAFSMYSRIPVPKIEWNEKNMRYAFCFFPLIGAVIGVIMGLMEYILGVIGCNDILFGCIMSSVPVFITGGIHFDGFLDTLDAIHSYGDKEKRLRILKDPAAGAFAVTGGIVYFVLSVGFWSGFNGKVSPVIFLGYILSRALSAMGVILFPAARSDGLLRGFKNAAHKKAVFSVMAVFILITLGAAFYIDPFCGFLMLLTAAVCFLYHYYNCIKNFGGITGDLAGYFLQITELAFVIVVYFGNKIHI